MQVKMVVTMQALNLIWLRGELEWNGKIKDECEWGILEEAQLQ